MPLLPLLAALLVFYAHYLVHLSKYWDLAFSSTKLSQWMDTHNGHIGGWYHRLKHGHDLLCSLPDVYMNFGFSGLLQLPWELFRDFTTPHGLPLPGVQCLLVDPGWVPIGFVQSWLSLNIVQIFVACLCYGLWRQAPSIAATPIVLFAQALSALYFSNVALLWVWSHGLYAELRRQGRLNKALIERIKTLHSNGG